MEKIELQFKALKRMKGKLAMSVLSVTKRFTGFFGWGFYFSTGLDCYTHLSLRHDC